MESYSSIKNEILSFAGKWMELENIILREVSQVQKAKGHMWNIDLIQINTILEKQVRFFAKGRLHKKGRVKEGS
jgi:hypothetical protein